LLTNKEVLDVDQHSTDNRVVIANGKIVAWTARDARRSSFSGLPIYYVAVFNLQDSPQTVHYSWKDLSLPEGKFTISDLWEHTGLATASLDVTLPPHGCILYRIPAL
jgi:hypothetical protein